MNYDSRSKSETISPEIAMNQNNDLYGMISVVAVFVVLLATFG
ncbi:hypothetical protein [Vibrio owensii]|nr:hypothetical protein [Vibrio owensii]